ncbi:MAG: RNA methyltransferase [Candidatus Xenobia bacterium]
MHVVLDNVRSAFNVGSIFRTADAGAVEHIYLCGQLTCWPPHKKLEKTSLGAHAYVPWSRHANTLEALKQLRARGIPIVALETTEQAASMHEFVWPRPVALVFGHEVVGLEREVLLACDHQVRIPTFGSKNSLNVATAFGIVLYDVLSRR